MNLFILLFIVMVLSPTSYVHGDVYMHNPRGSNNRIHEQTAERQNANRLFNSQNNNRGGYNVGDQGSEPAGNDATKQYNMQYFQSSATHKELSNGKGDDTWDNVLRDGTSASRQQYQKPSKLDETYEQFQSRFNKKVTLNKGLQESFQWYDKCYVRERNTNLFTADQNVNDDLSISGVTYASATQTRQSPDLDDGDRYGYECPEERDYYPYWHPSPWKDVAVRTSDKSLCEFYQKNSFNIHPYHECVEEYSDGTKRHFSRWNNEANCTENGGIWQEFYNYLEKSDATTESACLAQTKEGIEYIWAVPAGSETIEKECLVKLDAPDCEEAEWTRTNHLGNSRDGVPNNYTWKLPHFPSGDDQRCVLRIRYNISTNDFDPWKSDAGDNDVTINNNPLVDIGTDVTPLRLNVNTAQFGRTFQDRSHVFILKSRPEAIDNERIFNLNVRGKRGNIIQTFPAVEYDFIPNDLQVTTDDLIHIQWTGSNTHDNNAPAGDGQSGDAGQGEDGTDRHNLVQIMNASVNFPLPYELTAFSSDDAMETVWSYHGRDSSAGLNTEDLALGLATSGYYQCRNSNECNGQGPSDNGDVDLDGDLNGAPASYPGVLLKMKKAGHFHYMCSRNNAFTNRSQKGRIIVLE